MAEKEPMIVIKKITVNPAGGHGGSWKVAFADFMTAMMAFFLLMWLLGQSEEVKKDVADHFSTPSIIEYHFSNYGVELTLEKLFLDLVNEPLKFFQSFITPADTTPNIMAMGSKRIVLHHIADKLGDVATNVHVEGGEIEFEIPADQLFEYSSAQPNGQFVSIMENVRQITAGLEDVNIYIDSGVFNETVANGSISLAKAVADKRLELVSLQVESALENPSVDIFGKANVTRYGKPITGKRPNGSIKFKVKNKGNIKGNRKPRELKEIFGKKETGMSVYSGFVDQLTNKPEK